MDDSRPVAAGKSSFDLVDVDRVFAELGLGDGVILLDVASGAGNYAVAAAEAMKGRGTVYAFDLWREGIEELKRRATEKNLKKVFASVADVSREIPLVDDTVDTSLIATALHDLAEEGAMAARDTVREVARVLKPGGRLIVVEFNKVDGPPGPPRHIRLSPDELDALVLPSGFRKEHTLDAGPYTYLSAYSLS